MSWFKRKTESNVIERDEDQPECPHVALVPRWDEPDDIGIEARASSYLCQSCGETFTPSQVRSLRASELARLSRLN
jgi:hypothetical protein